MEALQNIYGCLQQLGLGDKVIIDLGLVNQAEYYTGIIFRGYFDEVGEPVLSGGRYDKLRRAASSSNNAYAFSKTSSPPNNRGKYFQQYCREKTAVDGRCTGDGSR